MIKTQMNIAKRWQKASLYFVGLVFFSLSNWASAQSAIEQLGDFVQQVHSASGYFTQRTVDAQGTERPAQTGVFAFQRPGQFKWQVQRPYEQLVLSDGKQLYQYDPDLNQLTQRSIDQAIGASPAAILFGSGQLEQNFDLVERPNESGLMWLRATPKGNDAGFEYMDMGFVAGLPVRLMLLDAFGQQTWIDFADIKTEVSFKPADFTFKAPADVDVVVLP